MLISKEYAALNRELHEKDNSYGSHGGNARNIAIIAAHMGTQDILDYGCGKGNLAKRLPFPIKEYDPAIPGKDGPAEPADIVICRDVLEHIEPECIDAVLADLARCVKQVGFICTVSGPSFDILPDGRNAHVLQRPYEWWREKLAEYFTVDRIEQWSQLIGGKGQLFLGSTEILATVTPKHKEKANGQ